jgi:hypothetical protein
LVIGIYLKLIVCDNSSLVNFVKLFVFTGLLLKLKDLCDIIVLNDDNPSIRDLLGGSGGGIRIDEFLIDISIEEFCIYYRL